MLYVKTKITDSLEIKVDLYDDEIFATCPICGKEMEVGPEDLKSILENDGDFASVTLICESCTKSRKKDIEEWAKIGM